MNETTLVTGDHPDEAELTEPSEENKVDSSDQLADDEGTPAAEEDLRESNGTYDKEGEEQTIQ